MTRKRLQPDVRKQQILDASIRLFFEVGYEGASLRDLAQRVGINKATIYHYFESKEEILFSIIDHVGQELKDGLIDAATSTDDPLEALQGMIRFQVTYMDDHLEQIKVLVEEKKALTSKLEQIGMELESEIFDLYRDKLAQCVEQGLVRPLDPTVAAFGILGQVNWLYHWFNPGGKHDIGYILDQLTKLMFGGLLPEGKG